MNMIEIEIDGKQLTVPQGSMIIEAADAAGIHIPRFCYHKKLSIAANCRMCLVEAEKIPKPLPACATPVTAGMRIFTQSAKALDAQRSVMEFLLINHPLDCPICDQGGACELQDVSLGYGQDYSRYEEIKRVVKDEDLGSLVATDMTRCIQCTRCVRFGQEIAGLRELGTLNRGDRTQIGSYLKQEALKSELSANIIDLCPVGALTSKPFRFSARPWELSQYASIAPHDGVGSNIFVHVRGNKVMRVVPRENEAINETWLSDRDRFSYQALYSEDRLLKPMIKRQGEWMETDWVTALEVVATQLRSIKQQQGAQELAMLMSANATVEEYYLAQKLMRGLGSQHIDHRLHQTDISDQSEFPLMPALNMPIEKVQEQEVIVIIGSHINHEHPLLAHRVRKASLQGAKIIVINPIDYAFAFEVSDKAIVPPSQLGAILQQVIAEKRFEEILMSGERKLILMGALAFNHPQAAQLRAQVQAIADKYQANVGYLTEGANSSGAWLAGAVPHRGPAGESILPAGYGAHAALQAKLRGYLLFGVEPDSDFANPLLAEEALQQAEIVVAFSAWRSPSLLKNAHVLLPMAPYTETSGTFVNLAGEWQSFSAITPAQGDAKPAWKILRVLGNILQLSQFQYQTSEEIRNELQQLMANRPARPAPRFMEYKMSEAAPKNSSAMKLERIAEWPLYRTDMLVRRGNALQASTTHEPLGIRLHPLTAQKYQCKEGQSIVVKQQEQRVELPVILDTAVPETCVVVPAGYTETAQLSQLFGLIEIDTTHA